MSTLVHPQPMADDPAADAALFPEKASAPTPATSRGTFKRKAGAKEDEGQGGLRAEQQHYDGMDVDEAPTLLLEVGKCRRIERIERIEIPYAVKAKQMTCNNGKPEDVEVYVQRTMNGKPLIVLGLYPVANSSSEKVSKTEIEMLKRLDRDHIPGIYWNDFCVFSSNTTNKIINQSVIATWVTDPELVEDYYRRLSVQLDGVDSHHIPCVYVAGDTCQASLENAIKLGIVKRLRELSPLGVTECEMNDKRFVVLEGRPHPSWHLMTGNAPDAKAMFEETMAMVNGMVRCCAGGNVTPDTMTQSLAAALAIDTEKLQERTDGRSFLTQLLYEDPSGHFPTKQVHLRNVKAHLPEVQAFLRKWFSRGADVLNAILNSGDLYLDLPTYDADLEYWFDKLGKAGFKTFMCNSVASKLCDPAFKAELLFWLDKLGEAGLKTFMCGGVAYRLKDPAFKAVATRFIEMLNANDQFCAIFSRDSFVKRVVEPEFEKKVKAHFIELGRDAKALKSFLTSNEGRKLDSI